MLGIAGGMMSNSPHLEVSSLIHRFGDRQVLNDLSFSLSRGEIFGLLGPNGSGKSTALGIIATFLPLQSGEVRFDGQRIANRLIPYREKIGVIFQTASLDPKLSARENLLISAWLRGFPSSVATKRAEQWLDWMGLSDRADDRLMTFSGGMRRRIDIARALLHEPELLIMDEPTAGIDEYNFRDLWSRLQRLRQERRITIILATHRPEEAEQCDRLAILAAGKPFRIDTPNALKESIAHDALVIATANPTMILDLLKSRFKLQPLNDGNEISVTCESGHELIPRIVESVPKGTIDSIALRSASLADVFFRMTGQQLFEQTTKEGKHVARK